MSSTPQSILSKNRAEELGDDVWKHFVIPQFYPRLDLTTARKPRLIIGGRGCGKTMLLRYLSHQSMFSRDRPSIPTEATSHIGLFWKNDTHFASLMSGREISDKTWDTAFSHMAALILGIEVLNSLESIAKSKSDALKLHEIGQLDFKRLGAFDQNLPTSHSELRAALEERLWNFESWVSNVRKMAEPTFLPGEMFVLAIIEELQRQIPSLSNATFFVYVDEYENLQMYQQRIINSWLKHSEAPLIFNIAMKRNAFKTLETTGKEPLSDIHDFRRHDLEQYILNENPEVFFAEILFSELHLEGVWEAPINIQDLRDASKLEERKSEAYIHKVLDTAQEIFPSVSQAELARKVFRESALSNKLRENIQKALKVRGSDSPIDLFFRPNIPEASIVVPAILSRKSNAPDEVAREMDKLEKAEDNRFKGSTNWIHNNFVGSLLQLYKPYNRACPFYAGFRTFMLLSKGNIRHFLELCYKSINRALVNGRYTGKPISSSLQAEAARQASTDFLGEIPSFGPHGNQLHTFVMRLGTLFELAHQRPTLSESEQSHFAIAAGSADLSTEDDLFLRETAKWSVLFEEQATKTKEDYSPIALDYVLNPIYAPYFHISYRKRKKLDLTTDELICMIRGSVEQVRTLFRDFSKKWQVEPTEAAPSLFSDILPK